MDRLVSFYLSWAQFGSLMQLLSAVAWLGSFPGIDWALSFVWSLSWGFWIDLALLSMPHLPGKLF